VPYPWNKYAQVVVSDFIFGGMENTTATTMYEHILLDERAALDITSDDLIAHELAHQWFGDLVTCRDWSHAWLNEGFATFMEHVDREHHLGRDEYDYGVQGDVDAYVGRGARALSTARSSARTTRRRSTSSIATSTRRARVCSTSCAASSATRRSGRA
jgi:aminopeptidase N